MKDKLLLLEKLLNINHLSKKDEYINNITSVLLPDANLDEITGIKGRLNAQSIGDLIRRLKDVIDETIAVPIYLGIVHDTGIMQYSNTSPKTLRIVANLLEFGFDFSALIDDTFYGKTYVQNQIMGRALMESILIMDKRVIVSHIDLPTMKFYGVTSKDLDGIVSQLRYTKGVDCAVFMYETEPLQYKVSLRSNGVVDCAKVCQFFAGGGHVRAAGCNLTGTFYDVINNISAQIAKQI